MPEPKPIRLMHLRRATRAVTAMARPRPLEGRTEAVDVPGEPGIAYVFDPPRREPDGAVVIIPGMAVESHDDIRLHRLAWAFARAGLRGIVLQVPDMQRLCIRPETEEDVADRLLALRASGLIPKDRLGILGPSFSGSLGLRAVAVPRIAEHVHGALVVGAFADAHRTVDYLFHDDHADPYGRMLLLLNFLERVEPVSQAFIQALRVAIYDTAPTAGEPQFPAALEGLSEPDRTRLVSLLEDRPTWEALGDRLLEVGGDIFDAMSVGPVASQLRCQCFVLHGDGDPIVPPDESVRLHQKLQEAGVPSELLVTGLLDHANIRIGRDVVQQAWRMVHGFAFFLAGVVPSRG